MMFEEVPELGIAESDPAPYFGFLEPERTDGIGVRLVGAENLMYFCDGILDCRSISSKLCG